MRIVARATTVDGQPVSGVKVELVTIDRRYDSNLMRYFADTVWYPAAFWAISMIASVIAFPSVLLQRRKRARWISPDRGIRASQVLAGSGGAPELAAHAPRGNALEAEQHS